MTNLENVKPVVIGGGPSGLTAAYQLTKQGLSPIVLEKDHTVGGLAKTEEYKGFHFDLGGHRFFTKSKVVNEFWNEVLPDDFLLRPRLSRIHYRGKFFHYPLKPFNVLSGLGPIESVLVFLSYLRWQVFPYKQEETFEEWVTNRFGRRLFQTFFKTYTEKVWGIPCSELKAEWAAQRIKDLSMKSVILSMLFNSKNKIKSLIEQFHYPRLGPGMMWRSVRDRIHKNGGEVFTSADVVEIQRTDWRIDKVIVEREGRREIVEGTHFISSMPLTEFIEQLNPPAPANELASAAKLKYRDFLTVCLIVDRKQIFNDNWIYVHDPGVKVGRIQNFKNWSPDMVPNADQSSLGLEYFCNKGDELWRMPDEELIELGKQEVARLNLVKPGEIVDGCVVRVPHAYPVYDSGYREHLDSLKDYIGRFDNVQTIGRNGLHRYNNQDHAMLTGMLAAQNLLHNENHDLWSVNEEQEYHEEVRDDDSEQQGER